MAGVDEVLRMPGEEQALRPQQGHHAFQQAGLGRLVEVDHHVAAEDRVEFPGDRPVCLQQVDLAELHQLPQFLHHPRLAGVGPGAAEEEAFLQRRRHLLQALQRIDALAGAVEHPGIDVRGDDLHRRIEAAQRLHQGDGDRIGFLAGTRRRRPDAQRAMPLQLAAGEVGEQGEVVAFAKECGEVGGQRVDEQLLLARLAVEVGEIFGEAAEPQQAQAPREAAIDQLRLALGQADAGQPVEPLAYLLEVLAGVVELPGCRTPAKAWRWALASGFPGRP